MAAKMRRHLLSARYIYIYSRTYFSLTRILSPPPSATSQQLQRATANFGEASWRKSYVSIQDAGQQRAFKVKFVGEGVDDHGGPYRALFSSCAVEEPAGCLELLVPVPNERGG